VSAIPVPPGAGIKPKATAVKTDPYKAAKEARTIVRWLSEHVGDSTSSSNGMAVLANEAISRLRRADDRAGRAQIALIAAKEHAVKRQASPAKIEIDRANYNIGQAKLYHESAFELLNQIVNDTMGGPPTPKSTMRRQIDKLHLLVQALPTEPDMPLGAAENVLRAIVTLLRNIGLEATDAAAQADGEADHASP
jgi:hypothetical protein